MIGNIKRFKSIPVLTAVTGVPPQTMVAAQSGYSIGVLQFAIHENNGLFSNLTITQGNDEFYHLTIGPSGTIIWDFAQVHELPIGSGVSARLDSAGNVNVQMRYVLYDNRTPVGIDRLNYKPITIRKPNSLGKQ